MGFKLSRKIIKGNRKKSKKMGGNQRMKAARCSEESPLNSKWKKKQESLRGILFPLLDKHSEMIGEKSLSKTGWECSFKTCEPTPVGCRLERDEYKGEWDRPGPRGDEQRVVYKSGKYTDGINKGRPCRILKYGMCKPERGKALDDFYNKKVKEWRKTLLKLRKSGTIDKNQYGELLQELKKNNYSRLMVARYSRAAAERSS